MAVVSPKQIDQSAGFATLYQWGAITTADTGDVVYVGHLTELSAQATSAGGAVVTLQGSMDGTNWGALTGSALTSSNLTVAGGTSPITTINERPLFIRVGAVGTATATGVFLSGKRYN